MNKSEERVHDVDDVCNTNESRQLPNDLKADIERFSVQGFADSHFNTHKRWTLFRGRKKLSAEELLSFSKNPIKQSLTRLSKKSESFAIKLFPNIVGFVENDKKKWGQAVEYREAFSHLLISIMEQVQTDSFFTDEAFCQVIKMCINNPTQASTERAWALLYACTLCFLPSSDLAKYLYKQSRLVRRSPNCVGGFAICVNRLVMLQLQRSELLPDKIAANEFDVSMHIDPVMRYYIPQKVNSTGLCIVTFIISSMQIFGCTLESLALWEVVQTIADSMNEDLRSSTLSNLCRETLSDDRLVLTLLTTFYQLY